jgi:hypothetical protein
MRHLPTRDENGKPDLDAFANNGLLYGLPLGALAGVLMAGPHFSEWSPLKIFGMILGCGACAGILGYVAIAMAYGSAAAGFGITSCSGDDGASGGGDGGSGGGDGGGCSGGGDS